MSVRRSIFAAVALLILTGASSSMARDAGTIYLRNAELNAARFGLPDPATLNEAAGERASGDELWIVHFDRDPALAEREAVAAAGAELLGYLPENAYLVRAEAAAARALAELRNVDALLRYAPEWKVQPGLAAQERGILDLRLSFAPGTDMVAIERAALQLGAESLGSSKVSRRPRLALRAGAGQLDALSRLPGLVWLCEAPVLGERNDDIKWACQSGIPDQIPIWDQGIHGEDQIIGHIDSQFDMDNCWFEDPDDNPVGPTHRKVVYRGPYVSPLTSNHGTHTAGTAAGNRVPTTGAESLRGLAFEAKLANSPYYRDPADAQAPVFILYDDLVAHHGAGARVHTNSWGDDSTTDYTIICQDIDAFSRDYEEDAVVFASTNQSTLKSPENAKNVLAVGATRSGWDYTLYYSAGRGPTNDGRLKPEIFAPGQSIESANAWQACAITTKSGCSMACPAVAGGGALVRQYFTEGWYPSGAADVRNSMVPSGALIRAVLLNATLYMDDPLYPEYPNIQTGWGRLALDESLYFFGEDRQFWVEDIRNAQGLETGQQHSYPFTIQNSDQSLKITLVFTDQPGEVEAAFPVVNDLNLVVTSPSATYLGNVFNVVARESSSGPGSADALNNVERVLVAAPEPGIWTITIVGQDVPMGPQGYGLSVSAIFEATPVALSFFTTDVVDEGVDLMWEIADYSNPAELRLVVDHESGSREVEFTETSPDTYSARDRHPDLRHGGRYVYSLSSREPGQDWQLLRSNSVELESAPFATALIGAYPNPFNPLTRVRFSLAARQRARLEIFDIAGRRVALLADDLLDPGEYERDWFGRDDSGRDLASGVYFLRLVTPGSSRMSKLVLVR